MHICTHTNTRTSLFTQIHIYTQAYSHKLKTGNLFGSRRAWVCARVNRIHTCIYVYTRTHSHMHTQNKKEETCSIRPTFCTVRWKFRTASPSPTSQCIPEWGSVTKWSVTVCCNVLHVRMYPGMIIGEVTFCCSVLHVKMHPETRICKTDMCLYMYVPWLIRVCVESWLIHVSSQTPTRLCLALLQPIFWSLSYTWHTYFIYIIPT